MSLLPDPKRKKAYVCYPYGADGDLDGGPLSGYDHMSGYVKMIFNFIGIDAVIEFAIEATTIDANMVKTQMTSAVATIDNHFSN